MATSCKSHVSNVATMRHSETSYTKTIKRAEGRKGTQEYSTFLELEMHHQTPPNLPNTAKPTKHLAQGLVTK